MSARALLTGGLRGAWAKLWGHALAGTVVTRMAMIGLGFAASILTARLLGPAGRGEYYVAATFASTLVQFSNVGLHASNTYHVARDPDRAGALLGNSLVASVVGAGTLGAVGAFAAVWFGWVPTLSPTLVALAAALAVPTLFFMLGTNWLVGLGLVRPYNLLELASRVLVLVLMAAAGLAGWGAAGMLGASVVSGLLMALVLLTVARRAVGRLHVDWRLFVESLGYGLRAYVVALLGFVAWRGNVFLLTHWVGQEEAGYLSIAAQLADVLAIFPTSVALILFPALVRERDGWASTRKGLVEVAVVMAGAVVICALTVHPFIGLVFGVGFLPAGAVTLALLPGVFCLALLTVVSQYIAAQGMPWGIAWRWGAAVAVMLAASAALIPYWGALGAAGAASIGYAVMFGLALQMAAQMARAGRIAES